MTYEAFFTEYRGSPALLSENVLSQVKMYLSEGIEIWRCQSPLSVYLGLKYYAPILAAEMADFRSFDNVRIKNGFWILGASYNYSSINAINDIKIGKHSFYEQSLKTGKICKRGTSCFSKI